ncbi:hypothetical protein [Paraburkholderia sp. GAS32]|uniref:hypothetical protein n=1 Tax=Paraburkholderia sp. GAS32 TaxID=3035129 RepID=UPI003D1EF116
MKIVPAEEIDPFKQTVATSLDTVKRFEASGATTVVRPATKESIKGHDFNR